MRRLLLMFFVVAVLFGAAYEFRKWQNTPLVAPLESKIETAPKIRTIGRSLEGRKIDAYSFGNGDTRLVFIGGIHGGYEWNSVLLAYKFLDYLSESPKMVPRNLAITIIPSLNPDGVYKVTGKEGRFAATDVSTEKSIVESGRFNAEDVDLNRNFDCKWKPVSMWRGQKVSAGKGAFSEPEAKAFKEFVLDEGPTVVIFWHSQANSVYASECKDGILPATLAIAHTYAKAAGYNAVDSFDSYEISGDAEGWLASIGIPAITVELGTHKTIEWEKNLAGIKALFRYYAK